MDNFRRTLLSSSGGIDPTTGRGTIGDYEVVDLGLSNGLLFATCNVEADSETGYGKWYMYGKGSRTYNSSDTYYAHTENPLASSADTATQVMGEGWRMPTRTEFKVLIDETNYSATTINGIKGGKFTSKTNPNIYVFFPFSGSNGGRYARGTYGYAWSSSPNGGTNAYMLIFGSDGTYVNYSSRNYGYSVRGVYDPI